MGHTVPCSLPVWGYTINIQHFFWNVQLINPLSVTFSRCMSFLLVDQTINQTYDRTSSNRIAQQHPATTKFWNVGWVGGERGAAHLVHQKRHRFGALGGHPPPPHNLCSGRVWTSYQHNTSNTTKYSIQASQYPHSNWLSLDGGISHPPS